MKKRNPWVSGIAPAVLCGTGLGLLLNTPVGNPVPHLFYGSQVIVCGYLAVAHLIEYAVAKAAAITVSPQEGS